MGHTSGILLPIAHQRFYERPYNTAQTGSITVLFAQARKRGHVYELLEVAANVLVAIIAPQGNP
jgi:hypothetical protein